MSAARATAVRASVPVRTAPPRPVPRPATSPAPAPRLRVVRPPAQARTRVPFVVACMAVLAVALLTALLLNTTMARGAYAKADLDRELAQLAQTERDLSAELDRRASPASLAEAARALGMQPADVTGWIRLSDGAVQGVTAQVAG